jgi:DNA-directed RNA polymerase beta' subunit
MPVDRNFSKIFPPPLIFGNERVTLISSSDVRKYSAGEVKVPKVLDNTEKLDSDDNFRASKGGIYSEDIFGPMPGLSVKSGVDSDNRRINVYIPFPPLKGGPAPKGGFGHIELPYPAVHPYFYMKRPSILAGLLGLGANIAKDIVNMTCLVVIESDDPSVHEGYLVERPSLTRLSNQARRSKRRFRVDSGARYLARLLEELNLSAIIDSSKRRLEEGKDLSPKEKRRLVLRLNVARAFLNSGVHPGNMIMDAIPILPTEDRPLIVIDGVPDTRPRAVNNLYLELLEAKQDYGRIMRKEKKANGGKRVVPIVVRELRTLIRRSQRLVNLLYTGGRRVRKTVVK